MTESLVRDRARRVARVDPCFDGGPLVSEAVRERHRLAHDLEAVGKWEGRGKRASGGELGFGGWYRSL